MRIIINKMLHNHVTYCAKMLAALPQALEIHTGADRMVTLTNHYLSTKQNAIFIAFYLLGNH